MREIKPAVKQIWTAQGRWRIETKLESVLECKSADDPVALIGEGLDLLLVDEAPRIKEIAWTEALRPTLVDRKGFAVFIGSPKGKNWFYNLHLRGLKKDGVYESWQLPSRENPYLDLAEIEQARIDAPLTFEQEYEAKFMDDAGQVFRKISENAIAQYEDPQPDVQYVMGTDLAKTEDWTVSCVMRMDNHHVVAYDRFQGLTWDMQTPRIAELATRYNSAKILIDSTGVGDPIYDTLRATGSNVEGYKFTNPSKENLIRGLMIALENNEISYPEIPELLEELNAFEYTQGITGLMRYSAPSGFHDDCVIALSLVVEAGKLTNTGLLDFYKDLAKSNEESPKDPNQQTINQILGSANLQTGEYRIT